MAISDTQVDLIEFCPFCGARLPESLRDAFLDEHSAEWESGGAGLGGIDQSDDSWWRTRASGAELEYTEIVLKSTARSVRGLSRVEADLMRSLSHGLVEGGRVLALEAPKVGQPVEALARGCDIRVPHADRRPWSDDGSARGWVVGTSIDLDGMPVMATMRAEQGEVVSLRVTRGDGSSFSGPRNFPSSWDVDWESS